jgi:glycosyltransferase involved in cell wall biosynthesis
MIGPQTPLVSVGFPVFNEEKSLPAALDSILAQDYEHLEVIVCDNASTDATLEIAREYAGRDARIAVHESDANRGSNSNFNRCFRLASGRYFMWASGHDTRLPQAIRKCVEALEDDPRLVLCYPRARWRRPDGTSDPIVDDRLETRGLPPAQRLRKTVEELGNCDAVYGVVRSSALARTRLFCGSFGSDHVLLAELSLLGDFHQLDETLFVRTDNRLPEDEGQRLERVFEMHGVRTDLERSRPYTVMGFEHVRGAWNLSAAAARPTNAGLAAFWYARRWGPLLASEWHLARPARAALDALEVARQKTSLFSATVLKQDEGAGPDGSSTGG